MKIALKNDKILKQFDNECEIAKKLGDEHPHFAKVIGTEKKQIDKYYLAIEVLFEYGGEPIYKLYTSATDRNIWIWIIQSLSAFMYSQKRAICNFDIKPDNIVYDKYTAWIKVIDLGSSMQFNTKSRVQKPMRTNICTTRSAKGRM